MGCKITLITAQMTKKSSHPEAKCQRPRISYIKAPLSDEYARKMCSEKLLQFQRRLCQGRRQAHPRRVLQMLRVQVLPEEYRSVLVLFWSIMFMYVIDFQIVWVISTLTDSQIKWKIW